MDFMHSEKATVVDLHTIFYQMPLMLSMIIPKAIPFSES